jgi:hypothetical protein
MAISQVSDLNSLFNSIYEDAMFVARENNLMTSLVTNYSAKGWMTRYISTYPTITAEAVAETEDFANPTTLTKTEVTNLVPGEIMAQVILTNRRISTDPQDARTDSATELGNAVAYKIDYDLCADFTSVTSGTGTAGASLTLGKVAAALAGLRTDITPNPIYVVIHPYGWFDIWDELGTPAATYAFQGDIANEALRSYFVGSWLGVTWFTSANIAIDSSDDAVGCIFNPQALAFDSRKPPTFEPEYDASKRAWELNLSAGYGHGVRRTAFARKLTHDAAAPTS